MTLHEFAHQLDQEDGAADGAPVLGSRAMYTAWAHVLGDEFAEMFFEKPAQLERLHPRLYEQLALFYRQDPAARTTLSHS